MCVCVCRKFRLYIFMYFLTFHGILKGYIGYSKLIRFPKVSILKQTHVRKFLRLYPNILNKSFDYEFLEKREVRTEHFSFLCKIFLEKNSFVLETLLIKCRGIKYEVNKLSLPHGIPEQFVKLKKKRK